MNPTPLRSEAPIKRAYAFDRLPTDAELTELSDRWRPFRSLAVSYLFASEYGEEP